ncbi:putative inorganic phosphate cotransporter [Spodoptera frugiperda]|uniref:Putative inorganic phosphate cotransporter n=1 Tax=Spodoptera frugiperda TaxID=7108 RepID=A0A9R0E0Z9_SPOFR|nr:putative inorganic phosphate cotransporter [Spodoptera frugiperda]
MCHNPKLGTRHVQVLFLFLALAICFSMRVNMSMAIVAMTEDDIDGSFDWSMQTQSYVLTSFLWGYIVLQIPSGALEARYGAKVLLMLCMLVNSGISLTIPSVARKARWTGLCFCRVVQGLAQGCLFPSTHSLVSRWIPINEMGMLGSVVYGGTFLGTSMQLLVSGFIIQHFGWPTIFYVNGTCGTVWFVFYMYYGSDSPQKSNLISTEEKQYIQASMQIFEESKLKNTPWKMILTCCPFYALLTSHCGHNWGFWTLITELPTYMNDVLGVHITQNGLLLAIPYMTLYLLSFPFGFMTDLAMKHNWCSISACRKICNSIGEFGPAVMLIVLCQVPAGHVTLTVAMLSGVVGLSAGHLTGIWLTHIDMTPNFAGSVMGITNFFANITGIIAPLVAGAVIADEDDPRQWHTVFYISSGIYFVTNLVYIIFGSSEVQPWNDPDYTATPTGPQRQMPSVTELNSISRVRRMSAVSI